MKATADRPDATAAAMAELASLRQAEEDLERRRLLAVARARQAGLSWQQIGQALRMARQSAWERFGTSITAVEDGWREATLTDDEAMALADEALREVRRERGHRATATR